MTGSNLLRRRHDGVAGMMVETDLAYYPDWQRDKTHAVMDIHAGHAASGGARRSVVVLLHGGGWSEGDKRQFHGDGESMLVDWFVARGHVVCVPNFQAVDRTPRPTEGATLADAIADLAQVIKWVSVNAGRYGGSRAAVILCGYSSGGHLAALLAADRRWLEAKRLPRTAITRVITLDAAHFDIPAAIHALESENLIDQGLRRAMLLRQVFGTDAPSMRAFSPAQYVDAGLRETRFLLMTAGLQNGRPQAFSQRMTDHFQRLLEGHGVSVLRHHCPECEHYRLVDWPAPGVANCLEAFFGDVPRQRASESWC